MKYDDYYGAVEYDWWAVDRDGHVAVFSTAGFGPTPVDVLSSPWADAWSEFEEAIISRVPAVGVGVPLGRGPGTCQEWTLEAARGLYVFDWPGGSTHRYEKIVQPSVAIQSAALPETLRNRVEAVRIEALCFQDAATISVGELPRVGELDPPPDRTR